MSNFHILGTGCCGFLRAFDMLKNYYPVVYKGGKRKYQNGFEVWDPSSGLIWESKSLDPGERRRRCLSEISQINITHSYLPYVEDFLGINPSLKFLCLKGEREHSIKSLLASWGYRNPCFVKDRTLGVGHNRYPVDQFPDLSGCKDELEATQKFWDMYYEIAEDLERRFPNNFLVVDSPKFFSDEDYQRSAKDFLGIWVPFYYSPVDLKSFEISTTLHGGLGNNLFQMSEVISFCSKYDLPKPFFGTWDLFRSEKFPPFYNSDRFLGGHEGKQSDMTSLFKNLDWREEPISNFDVKFAANDMFRFGEITEHEAIRKSLGLNLNKKSNTASLHLRFCTRAADDHVNGLVPDEFYVKVFEILPPDVEVLVFSDDDERSRGLIDHFRNRFGRNFTHFYGDAFESLREMASCDYHILHVSTFSFWGSFLGFDPGNNVFCPSSFITAHGENMIPKELGWNII